MIGCAFRSYPELFYSGALTAEQTDAMYTSGQGATNCPIGRWLSNGSPSSGDGLIFTHIPQGHSIKQTSLSPLTLGCLTRLFFPLYFFFVVDVNSNVKMTSSLFLKQACRLDCWSMTWLKDFCTEDIYASIHCLYGKRPEKNILWGFVREGRYLC